jgi:hypothetical protein
MRRVALATVLALSTLGVAAPARAETLSVGEAVQRALAAKMRSLAQCRAQSPIAGGPLVARFSLGFEGRVTNVRMEGLPSHSPARACLVRHLSEVQMSPRIAFIVREIALPLPRINVGPLAAR